MDYTDIIESGRLIYSSLPSDYKLRNWPLCSTQLHVSYYKNVALSPIDKLICELLISADGRMSKKELGLLLGYDIASTVFRGQTYYTDIAEVEMYQRLLQQLVDWYLVVIEQGQMQKINVDEKKDDDYDNQEEGNSEKTSDDFVRITTLGRLAIQRGNKFSFHQARVVLYANLYNTGDESIDHTFPYLQELGVIADVTDSHEIKEINPDSIDFEYRSTWKDRLLLQLDTEWGGSIYNIKPQNITLPMNRTTVDFKLLEHNGAYKLLAYKLDTFCPITTEIINAECNLRVLNSRIKKCLFYKLINNNEALFTYNEVIAFWDNIEEDEYELLFKGNRIDWTDSALFDLIVSSEYCTTRTWDTISRICPTKVIEMHIDNFVDNFNWQTLSNRMDIDYILSRSAFSWDYVAILKRDDITKEIAQQIFLLPSTKDAEWNWELVEKFLTIEFVRENIDSLNIDFYYLTSWLSDDDISLIIENPDKSWDWDNVIKRFSLQQIVNNLSVIGNHINIHFLLDLCFADEYNVEFTFHTESLRTYFVEIIKNGRTCSFSLKDKPNYVWNDQTIAYLEDIGLLRWESKLYEKGFAQYPFVKWTPEFFGKYYHKLTTVEDRKFVSALIDDMSLISRYADFDWDWAALSTHPSFANSEEFISMYGDRIDLLSWASIADSCLIEKFFDILHLEKFIANVEASSTISSKVSKEFIKLHPNLEWTDYAFTIAMCSGCKIDSLLIEKYYNRWDWELLSSLVSDLIVLQNVSYPWKSDILSKSISSSADAVDMINANKSRLDWKTISKYIQYVDFEIIANTYSDKWCWDIINQRFVSKFTSVFFSKESLQNYINWEQVSQQVELETLAKLVVAYPEKINWEHATKRLCSIITIDMLLEESCIPNWDWNYLTSYIDIKTLISGLEYPKMLWNWSTITQRMTPTFIIDNLVTYQDRWDWDVIWKTKLTLDYVVNNIDKIVELLNQLDEINANVQWSAFTNELCQDDISDLVERYSPNDGFHWDYECVYKAINDITKYVSQPHSYIDWSALSCSDAANNYFHYDADNFSIRQWEILVKKRLSDHQFAWNYKLLTRLESIQKGYQVYFKLALDAWDWDFISAEGYCLKANNNGEANLRKYKDRINFALLSKREDIGLSEEMLQSYIDESWDWQALSSNKNINVGFRFVYKHKHKDWNWTEVSRNPSIKWDIKAQSPILRDLLKNKDLIETFDWEAFVSRKDVTFNDPMVKSIHKHIRDHWELLSTNKRFIPSIEMLSIAKEDGVELSALDWESVSCSKYLIPLKKDEDGFSSSDLSFVRKYAEYLNWADVTQNVMFDIYNDTIVDEFKDYIDWNYISRELENDKLNINYLCSFKEYLDWNVINRKIDYNIITEDCLGELKDYLDWTKISNLNFMYTENLLSKFSNKWDWKVLLHNTSFTNLRTEKINQAFKSQLNIATFMDNFEDGSPKIYHFTHLFNVIEVLKNRKILSRNRARELDLLRFDSAGNVVGRTSKAHSFARFYFRTNTPTQFYNECLGWDVDLLTKWKNPKSYYPQALKLGLPKCPMPVFLEFDLQEVLSKNPQNSYYSNGNMQTNWASVFKVEESPCNLRMKGLYGNEFGEQYVRDNSQQEFLIKDEFDFSDIKSLRIYCYDKETAEMLKCYLGNDQITQNIYIGECFSYNNRSLRFVLDENEGNIQITSNYNGEGEAYFLVKGDAEILNTDDVKEQTSEGVVIYPRVNVRNTHKQCEIYFIDMRARTKQWMIYSNNGHLPCSCGMKLHLEQEILDNIKSFVHEMSELPIGISKDLFQPHMLHSCHGIAHTTRVLFATHLIVNILHLSVLERRACCIASIIHDLGKSHDSEGTVHGLKSMKLYEGKISRLLDDSMLEKRVLDAVRYHSVEDKNCPEQIVSDVIWKVLKDADALDRSRFKGRGCAKTYLRLPIYNNKLGCNVFDIMSLLPQWTSSLEWDEPYEELINQILKYID